MPCVCNHIFHLIQTLHVVFLLLWVFSWSSSYITCISNLKRQYNYHELKINLYFADIYSLCSHPRVCVWTFFKAVKSPHEYIIFKRYITEFQICKMDAHIKYYTFIHKTCLDYRTIKLFWTLQFADGFLWLEYQLFLPDCNTHVRAFCWDFGSLPLK